MGSDLTVPFAFAVPDFDGKGVQYDRFYGPPHIDLHYHPMFELVFVQGSSGRRLIGDDLHVYGDCDGALVGPNLPHSWIPDEATSGTATTSVALFTRESLGLALLDRPEMAAINRLLVKARRGVAFPAQALAALEPGFIALSQAKDPCDRLLHFLLLLNRLAMIPDASGIVSADYHSTRNEAEYRKLAVVLDHFRQHLNRQITLSEMAGIIGVSVPTFTRFFRRMTGSSLVDFINRWRIDQACVYLRETEQSILDLSLRSGFSSLAHFNRQFRRWRGCSPREFRAKHR